MNQGKPKLKPINDAMRRALAALGETPEEHQAEILSRANRKALGSALKSANASCMAALDSPSLESATAIVDRWKAQLEWRAEAVCLFVRVETCRTCGATCTCTHWPELFIRERLFRADQLNTRRYTPAREAHHTDSRLPHIRIEMPVSVGACASCPDWQTSQPPLENPIWLPSSSPESTASTESVTTASSTSSEGESPSRTSSTSSPSGQSPAPGYGTSLPDSTPHRALLLALHYHSLVSTSPGSTSARNAGDPLPAPVTPTPFPIGPVPVAVPPQ